jgi:hypothetical protein
MEILKAAERSTILIVKKQRLHKDLTYFDSQIQMQSLELLSHIKSRGKEQDRASR